MASADVVSSQLAKSLTFDAPGIQAPPHALPSVNTNTVARQHPQYILGYSTAAVPDTVFEEIPRMSPTLISDLEE